jgi:hypothetical protein
MRLFAVPVTGSLVGVQTAWDEPRRADIGPRWGAGRLVFFSRVLILLVKHSKSPYPEGDYWGLAWTLHLFEEDRQGLGKGSVSRFCGGPDIRDKRSLVGSSHE